MGRPNLRKTLLINRPFQLSILGWFGLLFLVVVACYYFSNLYFFNVLADEAKSAGLDPDHIYFQYLASQKTLMNQVFLITSVVSFTLIILGGLFLSNKVAGPLYRLTQHLRQQDRKDANPVKFRKGDYFPELEEAFNHFISKE